MGRKDYYHDPSALRANSLVPGASAVVVDNDGKILLQQRSDDARWALPGGTMDIGEIYSDPGHVFAYDDGEVRQQFSVCFACRIVGGQLAVGDESSEVAFFDPSELADLDLHESIRIRLRHYKALPWRAALRSAPRRPRGAASPDTEAVRKPVSAGRPDPQRH